MINKKKEKEVGIKRERGERNEEVDFEVDSRGVVRLSCFWSLKGFSLKILMSHDIPPISKLHTLENSSAVYH